MVRWSIEIRCRHVKTVSQLLFAVFTEGSLVSRGLYDRTYGAAVGAERLDVFYAEEFSLIFLIFEEELHLFHALNQLIVENQVQIEH